MREAREKSFVIAPGAASSWLLERSRDLDDLEGLQLVADFQIAEAPDGEPALEAAFDLTHIVLEALERVELSGVNDDVIAQHAHLRAASDQPFQDIAAGHCAHLG